MCAKCVSGTGKLFSLPIILLTSNGVVEEERISSKESDLALDEQLFGAVLRPATNSLPTVLYCHDSTWRICPLSSGERGLWGFSVRFPLSFQNWPSFWWKGLSSSPLQCLRIKRCMKDKVDVLHPWSDSSTTCMFHMGNHRANDVQSTGLWLGLNKDFFKVCYRCWRIYYKWNPSQYCNKFI